MIYEVIYYSHTSFLSAEIRRYKILKKFIHFQDFRPKFKVKELNYFLLLGGNLNVEREVKRGHAERDRIDDIFYFPHKFPFMEKRVFLTKEEYIFISKNCKINIDKVFNFIFTKLNQKPVKSL